MSVITPTSLGRPLRQDSWANVLCRWSDGGHGLGSCRKPRCGLPCSFKERSSPRTMKVIPLSEAKAKLSHYGRICHDEPIVVTVNGTPAFQLVPLDEGDDLIDSLLAH